MTRLGRAILGASLGAALTLLVHPASRPYLFSGFVFPSQHATLSSLDIPNNAVELSDWMTEVGDRFKASNRLRPVELKNAASAAAEGVRLEPRNAYWHQMLASIDHLRNDDADAQREWMFASRCDTWNDYQSAVLMKARGNLAKDFGAGQSWQLADVYYQRRENAVAMISSYSKSLLNAAPLPTNEGLKLRVATILNGYLIRQGAHSIKIGNVGALMTEDACLPHGMTRGQSHHKHYLAQMDIHRRLRDSGQPLLAEQVNRIYRELDGWAALENADDAADFAAEAAWLSLLYVSLPNMLLVIGAIGFGIWFLGHGLRKLDRILPAQAVGAGIVLGLGAYAITFLPLAALATFLCCLFLTFGPKRERRVKVDDLGPMFSFTAGALALVFMLLLGCFVVGAGAPAVSLMSWLSVPSEYYGGSGVLLGLSVILLALLLLLAPLFAVALRVATSFVLSTALKKFGGFLGFLSLAGIVIATPICIYFDRENSDTLQSLVTNEPVYYLTLPR